MQKIINIHLAGRIIPIDESAYELLREYLDSLRKHFSGEEGGEEIIHDMEDRIGELFQDCIRKGQACVLTEDVKVVMSVMGSPEQIIHETGDDQAETNNSEHTHSTSSSEAYADKIVSRRLCRSEQEKVIGGVCGGIGMYLQTDPAIIRIFFAIITLAWGTGIWVYLLLWILLPVCQEQPVALRRRLYRNTNQKFIAGVCSGIASYFRIDPIFVRLVFLLPWISIPFFNIADVSNFLFPAFAGSMPSTLIIYLILWISLPKANTLTEKLEMSGAVPDVHNLSQAIKSQGSHTHPWPTSQSKGNSILAAILKGILLAILFFVLFIFLAIMMSMVAGFLGIASVSMILFPITDLLVADSMQTWMLWICGLLVLVLPIVLLVRFIIRLFKKKTEKRTKSWITISLITLFVLSVFGFFSIVGNIATDFRITYQQPEKYILTKPQKDTLYIRQQIEDQSISMYGWEIDTDELGFRLVDDTTLAISTVSVEIKESADSLYHINIIKTAQGKSQKKAMERIDKIDFSFKQVGDTLVLPKDIILSHGNPFRGQKVQVKLFIPKGHSFYLTTPINSEFRKTDLKINNGNISYKHRNYSPWIKDRYYTVGKDVW